MLKEKIGGAQSKICPKSGFIRLWTKLGNTIVMPTNCKTWSCLSCRDRLKAVIRARIRAGLSDVVEGSYFITLTYKTGSAFNQQDAISVRKDWTAWLRRMKQKYPQTSWFRVIEITKANQPHLHILMTGIGKASFSCGGRKHAWGEIWTSLLGQCKCLEHELGYLWNLVTGDSWVVAVRPVLGEKGASAYLLKYVTKAMMKWEPLYDLGFRRRWSCSRNWKGGSRLRLQLTIDDKWAHTEFRYDLGDDYSKRQRQEAKDGEDSWMSKRNGDPIAWQLQDEATKHKALSQIRRAQNANLRP